jgi:predicted Fe-Mo cluster-binding NifX family protein
MKIAVPTDDGINIHHEFSSSRAFLVITVNSGIINEQEIRWNYLSEMLTSKSGTFYNLFDCDAVIVNSISCYHRSYLTLSEKKVIETEVKLISGILPLIKKEWFPDSASFINQKN